VAVGDFDGDGRADLYVANDGAANQLWMQQPDGTFRDDALLRGAALNADGKAEASMGIAPGDYDGDGDEDLFVTHLERESNTLYVNDGEGLFRDATVAAGLAVPSWPHTGFGTAWTDFDLDGDLDLVVANGAVYSIEAQRRAGDPFPFAETDQLFENPGPPPGGTAGVRRFTEISHRAGAAFAAPAASRGTLVGDLDGDGDDDLVVIDSSAPARVLLDRAGSEAGGRWIGLRAALPGAGGAPVRDALGAALAVRTGDAPPRHLRVRTADGYASARDPRVRVGLGSHEGPVDVEVRWPDGTRERFAGLAAGRYHTLLRGSGEAAAEAAPPARATAKPAP
jgi:hypothetical protein